MKRHFFHVFTFTLVAITTVCVLSVSSTLLADSSRAFEVETKADSVTVFPSMARVEKTGTVAINQKGTVVFDIVKLPERMYRESFRVGGKGKAKVKIIGTSLERVYSTKEIDTEIETLKEAKRKLELEDRGFVDELNANQSEKKFVEALVSNYSKLEKENMPARNIRPGEWDKAGGFIRQKLSQIHARIREIDESRRELREKINEIQAEMGKIKSKKSSMDTYRTCRSRNCFHWNIYLHGRLSHARSGLEHDL